MTCVFREYKEYEIKTKMMVHEQWLQLKMLFLLENCYLGGGAGWANFPLVGETNPIFPSRENPRKGINFASFLSVIHSI